MCKPVVTPLNFLIQPLLVLFVLLNAYAAQAQPNPADKIFLGGDIITVDEDNPSVQAIAVTDGKIQALGTEKQILKFKGADTEIVDLRGNTLMPGFIDIHTHPILSALMGEVVDVSGFNHHNRNAVMASLKEGIANKGEGEWVVAYGWDPALLPDLEAPTLGELDQLAPENPLFIITQTLHSGFANSLALQKAGIDRDTPNPPGGYFEKDDDGNLTGFIVEVAAMAKLTQSTPKFPRAAYVYLLTRQMETYARAGYTTVVAPGLQPIIPKHIQSLQEVAEHADAPVRVFTYPLFDQLAQTDFRAGQGNAAFTVLGPKLWIDGSPYAGGMAMAEPYLDNAFTHSRLGIPSGERGHLNYSDAELRLLVEKFHRAGWQISAHTQGERAVDQFLDAVEAAQKNYPRTDFRHRMEHCALITGAQLERAKTLGVTPSFYIDHVYYYGDALREHIVGPERSARFMPVNSAKRAGHRFSIHTDSPSSPIGPIRAMRSAVLRETRVDGTVLGPDERITTGDAIKALTINAAWQIQQEDNRGSLEVGKLADFTILSGNLMEIPPQDWADIKVVGTYVGGETPVTDGWSWRKLKLLLDTGWSMLFD